MEVIIDDAEVRKLLKEKGSQLKNLTPAMQAVSIILHRIVMKNFDAEGRPKKWAPLAPSTIASKRRRHGTLPPILVDSGTLRRSIHENYSHNHAEVATPMKYAKYLQFGTRKMPARPFLVVPDSDMPMIVEFIEYL